MAKPQRTTYFKITLDDTPGALLGVTQALKSKNLALAQLWGQGTQTGKADVYLVPKNPDKVREAWKSTGMMFEEGTGFFVKGADKTGALITTLDAIAKAGVNILASGAMAFGGNYGLFLRVAAGDTEKVAQALGTK